jgi:dTDP-glucose pyrophosphorylase
MARLQVLLPLAGLGSRFTEAGFKTPKPLIEVDGKKMFLKAISSLDKINADKEFLFIIRQEHADDQKLDQLINAVMPSAKIIVIPKITRGAAETALAAKDQLDPKDALIIMDCDLWFQSKSYNKMVQDSLASKVDINGGVLTFASDNPRYSYAKFGPDKIVTETAEKQVISNHAITGAYFFATAQEFIDAATKLLTQPVSDQMPEYYISLLYNILIDEGKRIQAATVDEFASFGTPEELAEYQARQKSK